MKKKFYLLIGISSVGILLHAQVGINTQNPQGILHIDSKGDTSLSTNTDDDIIVDSNGNMGIGTIAPQAKLDILGKIRINDGTQEDGYVLTSDANGLASWKRITSPAYLALDNLSSGINLSMISANNSEVGGDKWFCTNSFIKVEPGKQLIAASLYSSTTGSNVLIGYYYVSYALSTSSTYFIEPTYLGVGGRRILAYTNFPNFSVSTTGYWAVDVTGGSSQDLYLWVRVGFSTFINDSNAKFDQLGAIAWYENTISIYPLNNNF
ncbi:hypothetical protein [Dysgonomonas capnocytophagoides]|uniref:hypothetical protein n=1 Tax=Dysgonomonas capnocytophagoides TaxID=45254 RepID=UPI00334031F6